MTQLLNETELLDVIATAQAPVLLEPPYRRRYPPLGLMKLATALRSAGTEPLYARQSDAWQADVIFVTTLFTYDWAAVSAAVTQARFLNPGASVILGGIAATVDPDRYLALGDVFPRFSPYLDSLTPDYETDWQIDARWKRYSYAFTSRGCPNRCGYCFVRKLEPGLAPISWHHAIAPERPYVMLYDNNVCSLGVEHVQGIADELLSRGRRVFFDQAFDCKFFSSEMCEAVAVLPFVGNGLRTSFDRIAEDGTFQDGIQRLLDAGVPKGRVMAYVLYNYKDSPQEANYRAAECQRLGITPYPTRYRPIGMTDRRSKFISKRWTARLCTVFQSFWFYGPWRREMSFEEYIRGEHGKRHRLVQADYDAWEKI